ncbi:chromosome segregation ATPase [Sporosarcina luteola]|nr:chromosome segregation ATPase [Sporosarcina luteola]
MYQHEVKSNDPVQLKQTIIYLRAELNKYKLKATDSASPAIHELQIYNSQLQEDYQHLTYVKRKLEKRLVIYEKRIRTLERRLRRLEDERRLFIKPPYSTSDAKGPSEQWESKLEDFAETLIELNARIVTLSQVITSLSVQENQIVELKSTLDQKQKLLHTQRELITLLESYVEQLTNGTNEIPIDYILQQIAVLADAYEKNRQQNSQI